MLLTVTVNAIAECLRTDCNILGDNNTNTNTNTTTTTTTTTTTNNNNNNNKEN
jgi:hypothetical protein